MLFNLGIIFNFRNIFNFRIGGHGIAPEPGEEVDVSAGKSYHQQLLQDLAYCVAEFVEILYG
jgi:hypothetical protein